MNSKKRKGEGHVSEEPELDDNLGGVSGCLESAFNFLAKGGFAVSYASLHALSHAHTEEERRIAYVVPTVYLAVLALLFVCWCVSTKRKR